MIPISSVQLGPEVEQAVLSVLRSGMLAQGSVVAELERRFANLTGVSHAVAVNSGTTALVASLQALQLEPGDEVVTSPFTFVATLNAILEAGATAVFADIREDDFCVDPDAVAAAIGPRTRVLMPVHLYGQCADMDALQALVDRHGLHLVEDAAQAHAATFRGRRAGSFGTGCFSFYGTKNVTTGEGGIVTTDDDALAEELRIARNQGMRARYDYAMPGHNYRLTDLQAALALPQLDRLDESNAARSANATTLAEGLAGLPGLVLPQQLPGRGHVWHQFTVLVSEDAAIGRDELVARLGEREVGCGVYYPRLVFDYDCYREHPRVRTSAVPTASSMVQQVVSLPVHPGLTDDDLKVVVETVRDLLGA